MTLAGCSRGASVVGDPFDIELADAALRLHPEDGASQPRRIELLAGCAISLVAAGDIEQSHGVVCEAIAAACCIREKTGERHLAHIVAKLGVSTRAGVAGIVGSDGMRRPVRSPQR